MKTDRKLLENQRLWNCPESYPHSDKPLFYYDWI